MTAQPAQTRPSPPRPVASAGEAQELIGHYSEVMETLLDLIEQETALVRAGRLREAAKLEPHKTKLANLYVGPIDFTPAGQSVSLVDLARPDFAKFPKFAQALAHARVADLEPGDAIFIPSMWWHHVEALDSFNVLVNYWWRQSPEHMDSPINALMMAMMSVRDLPKEQRRAWQHLFDHYVFAADEHTAEHIPKPARGGLLPLDPDAARVLRARLLKNLNR